MTKNANRFYTYAYLRKDGTPYYVGKGTGRRWKKQHNVKVPPRERVLFLKRNLSEEEAIRHEVYMIAVFGRKNNGTGILRNLTDGGDGTSGYSHTEETKLSISNSLSGRKFSEERINNISKALKGRQVWNKGLKGDPRVRGPEGKKWWINSNGEKSLSFESPGPDWELGYPGLQKGKRWWTNPQTGKTTMSTDSPGDEWVLGRIFIRT
jgi:hypothetical protein